MLEQNKYFLTGLTSMILFFAILFLAIRYNAYIIEELSYQYHFVILMCFIASLIIGLVCLFVGSDLSCKSKLLKENEEYYQKMQNLEQR